MVKNISKYYKFKINGILNFAYILRHIFQISYRTELPTFQKFGAFNKQLFRNITVQSYFSDIAVF